MIKKFMQRYPPFLRMLFFVELWERFSFYGMLSLLPLYLDSVMEFSDKAIISVIGLFVAIILCRSYDRGHSCR